MPEWVAEMTCRFWRARIGYFSVVLLYCFVGFGEELRCFAVLVVVAFTHVCGGFCDCVVGRWVVGGCVRVLFWVAFIYLRWPHRPFASPSLPFHRRHATPRHDIAKYTTLTSPGKSHFTPSLPITQPPSVIDNLPDHTHTYVCM